LRSCVSTSFLYLTTFARFSAHIGEVYMENTHSEKLRRKLRLKKFAQVAFSKTQGFCASCALAQAKDAVKVKVATESGIENIK
jgi:hypothetical protein